MATKVPVWLYIIWIRPSSEIIFNATRISLTTPFLWRRTIQDVVLTSSDVQNGKRTIIRRRLLILKGSVAKRKDTGYAKIRQKIVTKKLTQIVLKKIFT